MELYSIKIYYHISNCFIDPEKAVKASCSQECLRHSPFVFCIIMELYSKKVTRRLVGWLAGSFTLAISNF